MIKTQDKFETLFKSYGLSFIKALLKYEEDRFDRHFKKGSVFEEINEDFGIFPKEKVYPVYFTGDVNKREGKIIFIGINPAYDERWHKEEQKYLERVGSFDGYCGLFSDFFGKNKNFNSTYYANIGGFLRRYSPHIAPKEGKDWGWYQDNLINLDFVPYHSVNTGGLRINDIEKYKKTHLKALFKILDYLNPQKPIFINGISTVFSFLDLGQKKKKLKKFDIECIIHMEKFRNVWYGTLGGYSCIGLPFQTRVRGSKDALVKNIYAIEKKF